MQPDRSESPVLRSDPRVSDEDASGSMEVTIPALDSSDVRRKSSSTRPCTLVITHTGQCVNLVADSASGPPVETEEEMSVTKNAFFGKLRETFEDLNLRGLLWLNSQGQGKNIDAEKDVLSRFHNSYLYGDVPLSIKLRTAIRSGTWSHVTIWVEFFAAVISVTAYVRQTYTEETLGWSQFFRRVFSLYFAADYVLRIFSAPVRLYYIFSTAGIIDLISSLPIFYIWSVADNYSAVPQMLRVIRARRILPYLLTLGLVGGTIAQQIFLLIMYTLGTVFIAAGIFQWVEYKNTPANVKREANCDEAGCFTFYQAFYFLIVTITTVGYGDFSPKSNWGRFVAITVILAAVLILPLQINNILQLASRRPYGGKLALQKVVGSRFIILSGNVSFNTVEHFLSGFYHPCHDKDMTAFPIRVVIMAPFKPSFELKTLLTVYKDNVEFIEGVPTKETDLVRAGAKLASAFFLLADHYAKDFDAEDAAQMTRSLSVHRHCGPMARVIVELLKPENCKSALWDEFESGIEVLCPEAIRFKLLARSCHIQGFSTFIINLFRSGLFIRSPKEEHWMVQYYRGLQHEVFPVILPPCLHRQELMFEEVVEVMYLKYRVILFGLDVQIGDGSRTVVLYPRGRILDPCDVGLVIASDLAAAEQVSKFGLPVHQACPYLDFSQDLKIAMDDMVLQQVKNRWKEFRRNEEKWKSTNNTFGSLREGLKKNLAAWSSRKTTVTSLEDAIEAATRWPPLKLDKPDPPVLARRAQIIQAHLQSNTMNVVRLPSPHILVCIEGMWPVNLFYFVSNLRINNVLNLPVVILHPNEPTAAQWGCVGLFSDVYFVQGTALYELDLIRAGVLQAERVVILTETLQEESIQSDDSASMSQSINIADLNNVRIAANVERLISPARGRVIVELQQENQIQFLRPKFNIDARLFHTGMYHRDHTGRFQFAPPYIEGKGFSPGALTFLIYATFFNSTVISIVEQLSSGCPMDQLDEGSAEIRHFEQIAVPRHYQGQTFSDLFLGLLEHERILALGLYRPLGTQGSVVCYVSTNPEPSLSLVEGDLVYVLK
ncbi:calcium-activated potassium channel subunit alpha-1 isoform X2 [Selaginella moellendorffii]|uniref:calcium-activated potassium channel subunit alpha-1 isoform X2 n=1 Tax=Selaginella moellendorffii TaxID=88036 RepID=UPI000D1C9AEA|nr:calcium-activated potassium channel subunit alpha-1 isoform X2 [Selaginella moellendorffii]|eukprot:XP_024525362.1 calcium-activated potassium channel subunit alpha-1 isoform X2 [Selaginella moellendorffii]